MYLLDPHEPFSLVVDQFEIAHGLSDQLFRLISAKKANGTWPNTMLPLRIVLIDTPGLTQDTNPTEYNMKIRLYSALYRNIDGILVMLPTTTFTDITQAIQRLFSTQSDEGRRIRDSKIQIHVAITKADEKVTPTIDADINPVGFVRNMFEIHESLKEIEDNAKQSLSAVTTRCVTNHYKKTQLYIQDLANIKQDKLSNIKQDELAQSFEEMLGNQSSLNYLVEIISKLQSQIFPSYPAPVIFKSLAEQKDNATHFKVELIPPYFAMQVAESIAATSIAYHFSQRLHWKTAIAFLDSVRYGYKFVSRAIVNGKINIYIDGDLHKASGQEWTNHTYQITAHNVDFENVDSLSLLSALGLNKNESIEIVRKSLQEYFFRNISGAYYWRYHRALSQTVRRLSYAEPHIMQQLEEAFIEGRRMDDASNGVGQMLQTFQHIYQSPNFYLTIQNILNEELTCEFNKLFYVI